MLVLNKFLLDREVEGEEEGSYHGVSLRLMIQIMINVCRAFSMN